MTITRPEPAVDRRTDWQFLDHSETRVLSMVHVMQAVRVNGRALADFAVPADSDFVVAASRQHETLLTFTVHPDNLTFHEVDEAHPVRAVDTLCGVPVLVPADGGFEVLDETTVPLRAEDGAEPVNWVQVTIQVRSVTFDYAPPVKPVAETAVSPASSKPRPHN